MSDQWEKLKDLFDTALNLSGQQQEEFLSGINAQDPVLCAQLKRLLEQHEVAGAFLQGDNTVPVGNFIPGQTVAGRYRVVRQLGRGGMGEVYEAFDTTLNEKIALKTVHQDATLDSAIVTRLVQELQLARKVTHSGVCRVYDIGRHTEIHRQIIFFTMELLHGETLAERLRREGKLTPEIALSLARGIADGIDAAHARGIVHRDLKPANIMLAEGGRVVIMDFGLARDSGYGSAGSTSQETCVFGTPGYISPEQAAGRRATRASDIYAFGVVLHEMLTGRKPTDDTTQTATCIPDINPVWNNVIRRCLEPRPEHRFQDAAHIIRALEQTSASPDSANQVVRAPEQDSAQTADGVIPSHAARQGWRVFRGARTVALLACVAGILVLGWLASRGITSHEVRPNETRLITQLTTQNGAEFSPSLSPDGKSFVYTSAASGNWDIYLQRVGGKNAINLTGDNPADDIEPAFSPNGEYIAFRSERDGGGIYVMGATGESVKRITDFGYNPAWSPDGTNLVIATESIVDRPNDRYGRSTLSIVNVATSRSRQISTGDAVQPSWSPHGQRIAYWSSSNGIRNIWTIKADGGSAVPVTNDSFVNWNPVWSPDGHYIYFSSDRGGNWNLWRVPIVEESGQVLGQPEIVTTAGGTGQRQHITMSRDGSRIAYVEELVTQNIQKAGFDPIAGKVIGSPSWVIRRTASAINPDPSPDGSWVTYQSWGEQEDIYVARSDGTGERQLTNDKFKDRIPRWSANGDEIAFYSNRSGTYEIWLIHPDGTGLQQVTNDKSSITRAIWSPDGTHIAGQHLPGRGQSEAGDTFIIQIDRRHEVAREILPKFPVPDQSFIVSSWSPDGAWLAGQVRFTTSGKAAGLAVYSIQNHSYDILSDIGDEPAWLNDNRHLLFMHEGKLSVIDRLTKVIIGILSVTPDAVYGVGSLTRDNRTIYLAVQSREADVWLMSNPHK